MEHLRYACKCYREEGSERHDWHSPLLIIAEVRKQVNDVALVYLLCVWCFPSCDHLYNFKKSMEHGIKKRCLLCLVQRHSKSLSARGGWDAVEGQGLYRR